MIYAIIPAFEEEETIMKVIEKTLGLADRIIVVNDASTNGTKREIEMARFISPEITLLQNPKNMGKGASLRYAYLHIITMKPRDNDSIFTIDADMQHDPLEMPKLIRKLNEGYDMVIGMRDKSSYGKRKRFGNAFLSIATSIMSGQRLHDSESGFRCYKMRVIKEISPLLRTDRYGTEIEHIILASKRGFRIGEVGVSSHYIRGKGVTVMDGVKNFIIGLKTWVRVV